MREITIRTDNGTYVVRKPVGRFGVRWLAILFEMGELPPDVDIADLTMAERKEMMCSFVTALDQFTVEVLPHIYVSGPFKPDDMPPEDIMTIFVELAQSMQAPSFPGYLPGDDRTSSTVDQSATE